MACAFVLVRIFVDPENALYVLIEKAIDSRSVDIARDFIS